MSFKKEGATEQKRVDFQAGGWGTSCTIIFEGWRVIHVQPVCFLVINEEYVLKALLYLNPLIIEFFWYSELQFRIEEKIHTEVAIDVYRRGSFGSYPGLKRHTTCLEESFAWRRLGEFGETYAFRQKTALEKFDWVL